MTLKRPFSLKSGERVIDRCNSHIHGGISYSLLRAALARVDSGQRQFFVEQVEFNQPIGETACLATTEADSIVYAVRSGRMGHSRFVLNRKPEPCSSLVVILKKADDCRDGDYDYVIITAFIGHRPEPEPYDLNLRTVETFQQSLNFWQTHALVWGSEEIKPGTEVKNCPWRVVFPSD